LWEIYAREEPWGDMKSFDVAYEIRDGKRLQPVNCPPEIAKTITICFQTKPNDRPSFEELFKFFSEQEMKH